MRFLSMRLLLVHGDEWDIECEVRQLDGPEWGAVRTSPSP